MTLFRGVSAFGDVRTIELVPVVGWKFPYSVNTDFVDISSTGAGGITHADSQAVLSTGASSSSTATMKTRWNFRYINGLSGLLRITSVFSPPVTGSYQLIGLNSGENAFVFGYRDTDFVFERWSDGS